ncbi:MAG: gamma carbonic anhydrase family protein [Pseudolabrys sp.]|nr:gamma carbonic anhydrase family protein [Pseudolabrys sp.]
MPTLIAINGRSPVVAKSAFIAENAVLIGDVEVGEDVSIWFGAVLRGDFGAIRIGARSNIQDNVVVHSEGELAAIVEPNVTVGHAAIVHACTIGSGCVIGMGAMLLSGSRIGTGSMIAAGSVVLEGFEVPDGVLAAGNPATVKKKLDGRAAQWLEGGADSYVALKRHYMGG